MITLHRRSNRLTVLAALTLAVAVLVATVCCQPARAASDALDTSWCNNTHVTPPKSCAKPGVDVIEADPHASDERSLSIDAVASDGATGAIVSGTIVAPHEYLGGAGPGKQFSIEHVKADGSLDTSYRAETHCGSAYGPSVGYTQIGWLTTSNTLQAMAVDTASGEIFTAGDAYNESSHTGHWTTMGETDLSTGGPSLTWPASGLCIEEGTDFDPFGLNAVPNATSVGAIAVQPSKGLLLGEETSAGVPVVGRVFADGTSGGGKDTSFGAGTTGYVKLSAISGTNSQVDSMQVASDGSIYAAGVGTSGGKEGVYVCKLTADGSLVTSYANSGCLLEAEPTGFTDEKVADIVVESNGSTLVAVDQQETAAPHNSRVAVMRFDATGKLDTGYGSAGVYTFTGAAISGSCTGCGALAGAGVTAVPNSMVDTGYGRVIVSGYVSDQAAASAGEPFVLQLTAVGALDTNFANGAGYEVIGVGPDAAASPLASSAQIALTSSGTLFVAGSLDSSTFPNDDADGYIMKLTTAPTVDTVAPTQPTTTTTSPSTGTPVASQPISVNFSGSTDGNTGVAGYSTSLDTNPSGTPDSTIDVSAGATGVSFAAPTTSGSYYVHIAAIDAAGNISSVVTAGPFKVDAQAPTFTQTSSVTQTTATFTVRATDTGGSGLAPKAYSFNGGAWQSSPAFVVSNVAADTNVSVSIRVRDAAGNVSATQTFTTKTLRAAAQVVTLTPAATSVSPAPAPAQPQHVSQHTVRVVTPTGGYVMGPWLVLNVRGSRYGAGVWHKRVRVPKLGRNALHARIPVARGQAVTVRIVVTRRLSFASARLNRGVLLRANRAFAKRHPLKAWFAATKANIARVFHWIGRPQDYPHIALSPPLVKELQWRLRAFGYLPRRWHANSVISGTVIRAVEHYQRRHHISPIGTVGPKTRHALDRSLRKYSRGAAQCTARVPKWTRHEGRRLAHKSLARCHAHVVRAV